MKKIKKILLSVSIMTVFVGTFANDIQAIDSNKKVGKKINVEQVKKCIQAYILQTAISFIPFLANEASKVFEKNNGWSKRGLLRDNDTFHNTINILRFSLLVKSLYHTFRLYDQTN